MTNSSTVLPITGKPDADALLADDPLALLIGMILDQQVTMEMAFYGPTKLKERLGERFNAEAIAAMDPDDFEAIAGEKPAIHRFPSSMAKRIQSTCQIVSDLYDGDASRIWTEASSGQDLYDRLHALPGFGEEKTKIFIALLAKRFGHTLPGWEEASAPFSDNEPRSIADVASPETLEAVRSWKKAQKAAGKTKQD